MADEVTADERERLVERIITAEQDERRRLALFLHDGPVQSLAGIALMDFTYIGGDALAFLGYGSALTIMHAPIIGSPP